MWRVDVDTPVMVAVNVVASAVWLVASIDVLRSRRWENWRCQVLAFVVVSGIAPVASGVLVPVGAAIWWWWRRRDWLGHRPSAATPGVARR